MSIPIDYGLLTCSKTVSQKWFYATAVIAPDFHCSYSCANFIQSVGTTDPVIFTEGIFPSAFGEAAMESLQSHRKAMRLFSGIRTSITL